MKISDTIWRSVEEEFYLLEKYPNEEIVCLTNICLRIARANGISWGKNEYRLTGANEKALKFAFIGGY
jgi:hypothetical protein